jgi:DNA-binding LacI/PurR family transcriptional regulator
LAFDEDEGVWHRLHIVLPTIADVARHAGTTTTTVSRVINESGYVRDSVRVRVHAAIEALRYVPNANARTLKTKQSRTLGIVIGDLLNPYSAALADAVQRVAMERGYATFVGSASDDVPSEISVLEAFHRQRVAGLIVATLPTAGSDQMLMRLADHRLPLLLVGRTLAHPRVDTVSANFRRGGLICTQHLIELGHRRIAFIGARLTDAPRVNRLRGYLDALEQAHIPVRDDYVIGHPNGNPSPRYSTHLAGYQAVQQLTQLRPRPTAIFARNDYTAVGALQALREAGLRVPEDVSLAGFDNIPLASAVSPALTTVSQPTEEEGRLAAEFLIARIERPQEDIAPRELTLECNLIVRASTAPRPKTSRP